MHEEARAVGTIDAIQGKLGVDEAARLALREATLAEYAARRRALLERQAEEEADVARRATAARNAEIEREHAAALAEAKRLEAARTSALAALDEGRAALATPYERAIAAIDRWAERTRAALATWSAESLEAETAYTELTQTAADLRARAAEDEAERRLQASTAWRDGAKRALLSYVDAAQNAGRSAEHFMQRSLRGMEDALTTFVTGGKLSFAGLVDSIVADLARLAVRQSIVAPLAASLGLAIGGGGIFGTVAHAGGIAGHGGRQRLVAPEVFRAAPRLHRGGIAGDEVPAILRRGEGVFTPEQMRALGQGAAPTRVTVEIVNRGTPGEVRESSASFDARGLVIGIVTDDLATGGPIARGLQGSVPGMRL